MSKRALGIIFSDPTAFVLTSARSLIWVMFAPDREDVNVLLRTHGGSSSMLSAFEDPVLRVRELLRSPLLTFLVGVQIVPLMFTWCGVVLALRGVLSEPRPATTLILFQVCVATWMLLVVAGPEGYGRFRIACRPDTRDASWNRMVWTISEPRHLFQCD